MPLKNLLTDTVELTSGFREGLVKVVNSEFAVVAPEAYEGSETPKPFLALVWHVERLDEDTHEPLLDEDGEPQTEKLTFSFGGSSLRRKPYGSDEPEHLVLTPGTADGPVDDDSEVEDLGDEPGTSGPTIKIHDQTFKLNKRSSVAYLIASLTSGMKPDKDSRVKDSFPGCGAPEEIINRTWAPDYVGLVCHMKTYTSNATMEDRRGGGQRKINYKIVDKIVSAPWERKGKTAAGRTQSKSQTKSGSAAPDKTEELVVRVLSDIAREHAGETVTVKRMQTLASEGIRKHDPKALVPGLSLINNPKWLTAAGEKCGFQLVLVEGKQSVHFPAGKDQNDADDYDDDQVPF